jgi:hypothetical protein
MTDKELRDYSSATTTETGEPVPFVNPVEVYNKYRELLGLQGVNLKPETGREVLFTLMREPNTLRAKKLKTFTETVDLIKSGQQVELMKPKGNGSNGNSGSNMGWVA